MRVFALAAGLVSGVLAGGCSPEAGPKAYRVTGEAKFDGKAIPYGEVLFTPDGAQGNSGPQGIVTIRDGKYDTGGEGGMGVAGGATVVKVTGLDKPGGKLLCEFEYKVDLPRADSKHDTQDPGPRGAPAPKKAGPEI